MGPTHLQTKLTLLGAGVSFWGLIPPSAMTAIDSLGVKGNDNYNSLFKAKRYVPSKGTFCFL